MPSQIRSARSEDGAAVAAIYAPHVLQTAISFEDAPPTPAEMSERIVATLTTCPFLVFESDGEVLAYAYAGPHRARAAYRWSVDVTVYAASALSGAWRGLVLDLSVLVGCRGGLACASKSRTQ
jgi:L-amino acid N-acyltransferase YncA